MDFDTPLESTFSTDEGMDEDVDDPYYSLLSMSAPYEFSCMPNIVDVLFLIDPRLGLADSHLATIYLTTTS